MEHTAQLPHEIDDLHFCPDMNYSNDVEDMEQSLFPTSTETEFASLSVKEMEDRLEVGQPMENELVAYGLYSIYGRRKGFSVRKDKVERFPGGEIRARDFICSCAGDKNEKCTKLKMPVYVKPTFRCRCKAKLRVARLKGQNWRVTSFNKEHTHDMYSPDQTYLLRSARHLSPEMEKCIESMVKCGIPVARAYEFLQTSSNGRENVGFTIKDVHNSLSRNRSESRIENGDSAQLIQHFAEASNKEPYFFWRVERDENYRVLNIFYRDYRSRIDYEHFGDVLSIDTTYRTNKYNMICCPFIGINHHLKNVMFGLAFMSDETESSFEWLFRTFLESMNGRQPETVFTDQCQAMMNAVEKVFPHSHHRLCQWHISMNAPSHFGSLNGNEDFKDLWHKCMTGCHKEEEFELTWKKMMDEYDIKDKDWFNLMYGLRHKWATVFSCHRFSADLKATSRSEGTNAALKRKFGGATSSLYDCTLGFEKVRDSWRMDEKEHDTRSHHGRLPVGQNIWLKQAAKLYTLEIFVLFQKEVSKSVDFAITEQKDEVGTSLTWFTMKHRCEKIPQLITVEFDSHALSIKCSCHKFETLGLLCSHALKVFDRMNVNLIPEIYIKKRWTKSVTNRVSDRFFLNGIGTSGTLEISFVHETMRGTYDLATRAQFHKETRAILTESHEYAKSKINAWYENFSSSDMAISDDFNIDGDNRQRNDTLLRDPECAKSRGITDYYARHWDTKRKKGKGKAQNSKKTTKGAKRKEFRSETSFDGCPMREAQMHSSQGGNLQQLFQQSFTGSQHDANMVPSQYPFVYPFQQALLVSQPSVIQPSGQFPQSYEIPLSTGLGVGRPSIISGCLPNTFPYCDIYKSSQGNI